MKPPAPARGLRTTEFGLVSVVVTATLAGGVHVDRLLVAGGLVLAYAALRTFAKSRMRP